MRVHRRSDSSAKQVEARAIVDSCSPTSIIHRDKDGRASRGIINCQTCCSPTFDRWLFTRRVTRRVRAAIGEASGIASTLRRASKQLLVSAFKYLWKG